MMLLNLVSSKCYTNWAEGKAGAKPSPRIAMGDTDRLIRKDNRRSMALLFFTKMRTIYLISKG